MGRKLSEETKEKIRQAKLGVKLSAETRAKMSEAHKGKSHPHSGASFRGKSHTEQAKAKMSRERRGRAVSDEAKAKMSAVRAGIPKSEETRQRMSTHRQDADHPANKARSEATSRSNARRNIEGSGFHVKGHYDAVKAKNTPVAYRSVSIELRLMEQFDADPEVVEWQSPACIRYRDTRGVARITLPDFLVTYRDGSQRLIEGKGPHLLKRYLNSEKFHAVRAWCMERDIPFWIVTSGPHPDYIHQWSEVPWPDA